MLLGFAAAFLPRTAHADGAYASGFIGSTSPEIDVEAIDPDTDMREFLQAELSTGAVVGGALGYAFDFEKGGWVRTELELAFRNAEIEQVFTRAGDPPLIVSPEDFVGEDIRVVSHIPNLWYDFHTSSPLRPFIGGGIGGAVFDPAGFLLSPEDNQWAFAYQAGTGVRYPFNLGLFKSRASVSLQYRYFATSSPTKALSDHEVLLGFTMLPIWQGGESENAIAPRVETYTSQSPANTVYVPPAETPQRRAAWNPPPATSPAPTPAPAPAPAPTQAPVPPPTPAPAANNAYTAVPINTLPGPQPDAYAPPAQAVAPPSPPARQTVAETGPVTPIEPAAQTWVQLGAVSTQERAHALWKKVWYRDFSVLNGLSGLEPRMQRFDRGGLEMFRVQIGPFTPQQAEEICSQLQSDCFVVKNE